MLKRPLPSSVRSAAGRGMVIAILLASGYAAWAAQPEVPAVVPAGQIAADIVLRVDDGKPVTMRVMTKPGQAFSVRNDEGGKQVAIEGTVVRTQHAGEPALALDLRVAEDGKPIAAPRIVLRDGKAGSIQAGSEVPAADGHATFKGMRLDVTLTDSVNRSPVIELKESQPETARQPVPVAESRMLNPPAYPADAQKAGIAGTVMLVVDVAADGSVSGARVDRSAGDARLDAAALDAVKHWKFKPAIKDGKGVSSQVRVPIKFALDGDRDAPVQDARAALAKRAANASSWNSYDRMVRSLSASWEKPASPADEC